MPLNIAFTSLHNGTCKDVCSKNGVFCVEITDKKILFGGVIQFNLAKQINNAISFIDTNVNMALRACNKCELEVAHSMETINYFGGKKLQVAGLIMNVLSKLGTFES